MKYSVNVARGVNTEVDNLEGASKAVRRYIEQNLLGSSEWTGTGIVRNEKKKIIAKISYNGRVWSPRGKPMNFNGEIINENTGHPINA